MISVRRLGEEEDFGLLFERCEERSDVTEGHVRARRFRAPGRDVFRRGSVFTRRYAPPSGAASRACGGHAAGGGGPGIPREIQGRPGCGAQHKGIWWMPWH
jgi:hypothetical protein